MFLALAGRRDGHDFVMQAYGAGVRYFLVSRVEAGWLGLMPGAVFLVVGDVLAALQLLAAWHRKQLTGVVMGITGSNGKTIVKEENRDGLYKLYEYALQLEPKPEREELTFA